MNQAMKTGSLIDYSVSRATTETEQLVNVAVDLERALHFSMVSLLHFSCRPSYNAIPQCFTAVDRDLALALAMRTDLARSPAAVPSRCDALGRVFISPYTQFYQLLGLSRHLTPERGHRSLRKR